MAQDRYFVFLVEATDSYSTISTGMHAFIVPRSLYMESKLKAQIDEGDTWPLDSAEFYAEDTAQADMSEAVTAVTAGQLTGYRTYMLLQYLLHNSTGDAAYNAVDVTSYVPLLNLPTDALNIVPWAGITNGPTGAMPADFWTKIGAIATAIVNTMVQAGQLLYGGLIAIGTFFVALGEAIVDWGMKLVGTFQAELGQIQQAVERAGAILNELANFVIQQIQVLFASIHALLQTLWDASAGAYLGGIEEAFSLAIAEFEMTGRMSSSTASRLVAAFTAPMFWAFLGVAVAVVVGYVVYAVSTLGLGVLLASVGATIAASLAWQVFGLGMVDFAIGVLFDPGATIGQLIGPFLSWFASASWIDPSLESLWNLVLSAVFATGSLMANAVAYAASDQSGSSATVWGLSLGIFSLVLSFGTAVGGAVGKAFALVGAFFGFASVFFSVVGLLKSKSFYTVPSLVGNALGATGAALGVFYSTS